MKCFIVMEEDNPYESHTIRGVALDYDSAMTIYNKVCSDLIFRVYILECNVDEYIDTANVIMEALNV